MKIPVKIYDTIRSSLISYEYYTDLQFPKDQENNKKEIKELNKKLQNIENAFKWLKKHKRKQKTPL